MTALSALLFWAAIIVLLCSECAVSFNLVDTSPHLLNLFSLHADTSLLPDISSSVATHIGRCLDSLIDPINAVNAESSSAWLSSSTTIDSAAIVQDVTARVDVSSSLNLASTTTLTDALSKASAKAFSGGRSGAAAGGVQVLTLMWLRTTINYQYRYGMNTTTALKTLYEEGGIPRLYQGLPFALVQGPLSRFGDTAANLLILSLLEELDETGIVPTFVRTGIGSVAAGLWRIVLLPVDTIKTTLQVNGADGMKTLQERIERDGFGTMYNGALASSAATVVGHYPWFLTFNLLSANLLTPQEVIDTAIQIQDHLQGHLSPSESVIILLAKMNPQLLQLLRSGFIGLCASSVSDISSNSLRVLKTVRQTSDDGSKDSFSYIETAKGIIKEEGFNGLFGRGLQTKLLANGLQSSLFSVLFKYFSSK